MKKLMVWVVMLCMLSISASGEELPQTALELARRIDRLADSSEYLDVLLGNERLAEKVKEIAAGDCGEACTMMVNVDLTRTIEANMEALMKEVPITDSLVREEIASRLHSVLLFHAIAAMGADTMAIASSVTTGTMFATDAPEGRGIYLLFYGEHTPVAVQWTVKNGAASLSAMFVPVAELRACTDPQQVEAWFASIGAVGAVVTAVE